MKGLIVNGQGGGGVGGVEAGVEAAAVDVAPIVFKQVGLAEARRGDTLVGDRVESVGARVVVTRAGLIEAGSGAGGVGIGGGGVHVREWTGAHRRIRSLLRCRLGTEGVYRGGGNRGRVGLSIWFVDAWWGRQDGTQGSTPTMQMGTVLGKELDPALSPAMGFDMGFERPKVRTAIPNPATAGGPTFQTDGQIKVSGDTWTPGFNVGALLRPDAATLIGVSYRSGFDHGVSGEAVTTGLTGPLAFANGVVGAHAEVKLPAVASAGLARAITEKLRLFGQLDWYNWSTFSEIRVTFDDGRADAVRPQKYRNAWAASFGGDYAMSQGLVLRGGIRFDQTPTVDGSRDTIVPDANRFWMGVGATYHLSPRSSIDLAFTHVLFGSADVDVTRGFFAGTEAASTVRVRSEVDTHVNTLAASFNHAF